MSNRKRTEQTWLGLAAAAVAAAVAIVARIAFQHGGTQDLRVLYGITSDPHGITALPWRVLALGLGGVGIDPRTVGALAIVLCALMVGIVTSRRIGRNDWIVGLIAVLVVGISGFTLPILNSMLGVEAAIGLALLLLLAYDQLSVIRLPSAARPILIFCAIVQAPVLIVPSLFYTLLRLLQGNTIERLLIAIACISGLLVRTILAGPSMGFHYDAQSEALAAINTACILFLFAPLAVLTIKGLRPEPWPSGQPAVFAVLLAISAALSAPFSGTGDLALAWLGTLGVAFPAALAIAARSNHTAPRRSAISVALVLIAVGFVAENALGIGSAQGAIGDRDSLKSALATIDVNAVNASCSGTRGAPVALLGDGAETFTRFFALKKTRLLAIDHSIGECARGSNGNLDTALLQGGRFSSLPAADVALALAAATYQRQSVKLPLDAGAVTPRTNTTLRGHGAFVEDRLTAVGAVPSITVIAGFGYSLPCPVRHPGILAFAAANPLAGAPHAAQVRFSVLISSGARRYVAIERILQPTPRQDSPQWQYYSVSLPKNLQCRTLTFASSVPTSSAIAAWTTFVAPVLK